MEVLLLTISSISTRQLQRLLIQVIMVFSRLLLAHGTIPILQVVLPQPIWLRDFIVLESKITTESLPMMLKLKLQSLIQDLSCLLLQLPPR